VTIAWIALARVFVDNTTVPACLYSLSGVMLLWSHEFDAAVTVPMVVPVHKQCHPLVGLAPFLNGLRAYYGRYFAVRNNDSE